MLKRLAISAYIYANFGGEEKCVNWKLILFQILSEYGF